MRHLKAGNTAWQLLGLIIVIKVANNYINARLKGGDFMAKTNKSKQAWNPLSRFKVFSKQKPIEITDEIRERIAQKAYELYEQHGGEGGRDMDDWLQAEAMVMAELRRAGS